MFKKVPKNVLVLGVVSFFNDVASEMIYPLMPIFLTTVIGAPVAILGLIEGIAEGSAALMKFIFGYVSDRIRSRKPFVIVGYFFGTLSKVFIGFSYTWPFVLFARFLDRLGKGVRTSARDALLLENATAQNKGYIFGVHRAMDSAGAVVGPLIALIILQLFHENLRMSFFISAIPAAIGLLFLIIFVKEKKHKEYVNPKKDFPLKDMIHMWKESDYHFKYFFFVSIIFALGNSSDAFLLLQAKNLGFSTTFVVLTYVLYNISQTIFSVPGGKLADKVGAKKIFSIGLLIFAIVYFFFGFINNPFWMLILFPLYGMYIACTDGVSKSYISEFIKKDTAGSYFGLYLTGTALATFLASFIAGILWSTFSPSITFWFGSFMSIIAFVLLYVGKAKRVV